MLPEASLNECPLAMRRCKLCQWGRYGKISLGFNTAKRTKTLDKTYSGFSMVLQLGSCAC